MTWDARSNGNRTSSGEGYDDGVRRCGSLLGRVDLLVVKLFRQLPRISPTPRARFCREPSLSRCLPRQAHVVGGGQKHEAADRTCRRLATIFHVGKFAALAFIAGLTGLCEPWCAEYLMAADPAPCAAQFTLHCHELQFGPAVGAGERPHHFEDPGCALD